ncbi:MAG: hypothetical protein JWO43_291 [Candidatus Adlerbacteria bacterium]|nr:hypothetical protein [Candidatus Adlerbacteria bacterium]
MMHVIVGADAAARGDKRRAILNKLAYEELKWEAMAIEEIADLASTASLLGDTQAFVLVGALNDTERGEDFIDLAEGLMLSPHVFVFEEEKLLKKPSDALGKAGVKPTVLAAVKKAEPFNVFAIANALQTRDRKGAWLLLNKALRQGIAPENIAGVLHWKARDMVAAGRSAKYSRPELVGLSRSLVEIYHDSHRGAGDLGLLLERFILGL